jgi:ABC-type transport system substrate-binding protein
MAIKLRAAGSLGLRYGVAVFLFGSLLSFMFLANLGAQSPADKTGAKEPPKKDKGGLFDDAEVDETTKPKPSRAAPPPVVDLKQAARDAKHVAVRQFFNTLAVPHDLITYRVTADKPYRAAGYSRVKPLEKFYGEKKYLPRDPLAVEEFKPDWDAAKDTIPPYVIDSIQSYEQVAQREARDFMLRTFPDLPRYNQAVAAEQALSVILVWHESARSRGVRNGKEWDIVLTSLRKQLLGIMLEELKELTTLQDWEAAFTVAQRLSDSYPEDADIAAPLADLIKKSLNSQLDPMMRQRTRQRLAQLRDKYPDNQTIKDIIEDLKAQAQKLFDEAKKYEKSDKKEELNRAQELIQKALDTWELPGLRAYANQTRNKYPILRVGVRELPRYLSPGMACSDSEKRAVELLFESLVKFSPDSTGMGHYRPALAEARPAVISTGRQFQLPADAFWSNGEEVSAGDISHTVRMFKMIKKGGGSGFPTAWGELFPDKQPVSTAGSPHLVNVKLSKGYIEPLSLMTFKIMPGLDVMKKDGFDRQVSPQWPNGFDENAFAEKPIGSGPFMFVPGKHSENGREYKSFVANVFYSSRMSKKGLPPFREVRLFMYTDAKTELADHKHFLDLILDLTPEDAAAVKDDGPQLGFRLPLPLPNAEMPNRRVYFLAVNHRKGELQSHDLRVALAMAINREKLLDDHFRGPFGKQIHKALNGPYPAVSWANNPKVSDPTKKTADKFDSIIAETSFKKLTADERYRPPSLTLKYPSDDPTLKKAMAALAQQIQTTLQGIKITPEPLSPWDLRDAVEKTHDYDLAYYHYDFPDDTNSLLPLFGDDNYFGYHNVTMTTLVRDSKDHCNFADVQNTARSLHLFCDLDFPLIPLWQLDPLMAIHDDVKTVPFDRQLIFTDIELWRLEGKQR